MHTLRFSPLAVLCIQSSFTLLFYIIKSVVNITIIIFIIIIITINIVLLRFLC